MSKKREKSPRITAASLSRRNVLGGLGAIAATACGSTDQGPDAGVAGGGAGGTGSGGGGSGGVDGGKPGMGGGGAAGNSAGGAGAGGASPEGGAAGGTGGAGAGGAGAGGGQAGAGGANGGGLTAPPFDDVPACLASKTDGAGQGPFFIHELEKEDDDSLFRQDIRGQYDMTAAPGVEMHLHLRILDATSTTCNQKPLPDVDVYIWHTDAQGYYSGFGKRGTATEQKPDTPYAGKPGQNDLENPDRFCRGIQTTDANGVVSFRSVFPGWYNGRDLHIHLVAFQKGSMSLGRTTYSKANSGGKWLFTTQFYFDPAFSRSIHEANEPYLTRTKLSAYAAAMAADEAGNSGLRAKSSASGSLMGMGGIVTAQMQILIAP
jgi:protocatechuate 3,4-dioxygenase beta subunit